MSKQLYLIRGLPGSGKTTMARKLVQMSLLGNFGVRNATMIAADDYFYSGINKHTGEGGGFYSYDSSAIRYAHSKAQQRTIERMEKEDELIAIHNTFVQNWELQAYYDLADRYDYQVTVITMEGNYGSQHDVPQWAIQRMKDRWEPLDTDRIPNNGTMALPPSCEGQIPLTQNAKHS